MKNSVLQLQNIYKQGDGEGEGEGEGVVIGVEKK